MRELWTLFFTFAKIGAITFGGGIAMLPILKQELVDKKIWVEEDELLDYYAIGQCTPGIIAVNTATFIGHKRKGVLGGIIATLGIIFVPIIIISILALFIKNFSQYEVVGHALSGIRVVVSVFIFNAVYTMAKKVLSDKFTISLAIVSFVLSFILSVSPIILVILSTCTGLLYKKERKNL